MRFGVYHHHQLGLFCVFLVIMVRALAGFVTRMGQVDEELASKQG